MSPLYTLAQKRGGQQGGWSFFTRPMGLSSNQIQGLGLAARDVRRIGHVRIGALPPGLKHRMGDRLPA